MASLAEELATHPERLLQTLCDHIVAQGIAGSAGISLLNPENGGDQFQWVALAGAWARLRGGVMPIDASPCGIVVARRAMQLFEHPTRFFGHGDIEPPIHELLLVPFFHQGEPIGTLWIIAHDPDRKFDRRADRVAGVVVGQNNAFPAQAVDMRRAQFFLAENRKIPVTEIINFSQI